MDDPILAKVYKWDNDKEWVEVGSGYIQLSPIKVFFGV